MRNEWINARKCQVFGVQTINRNWTMQVMRTLNAEKDTWDFAGFRLLRNNLPLTALSETQEHVHVEYIAESKMLVWDAKVPQACRKAVNDYMKRGGISRRRSVAIPLLLNDMSAAYETLNQIELLQSEVNRGKTQYQYKLHNMRQAATIQKLHIDTHAALIAEADPAFFEDYMDKFDYIRKYVEDSKNKASTK